MDEVRYKIVFNGLVMMETPEETVKANMARLFKCDLARIEPLFSGEHAVLKRNLPEQEADRYVRILREAGAIVHKERDQAVKPAAAPVTLELVEKPEPAKPDAAPVASANATPVATATSTDPFGGAPPVREQAQRPVYKSPTQEFAELQGFSGYCELDFISLNGRLGRLRYLAWPVTIVPLLVLAVVVGTFLSTKFPPLATLGAIVVGIILFAFYFTLTLRRLHDINLSGFWMLLMFVPFVSFFFQLFLLLKAGDDGENDYGPPPPPNGMGINLMAGGMLLILVLMFGLSISAYTDDTNRMRTHQGDYPEQADDDDDEESREQMRQILQEMEKQRGSR
ncbi:MAG: DUF805 domain-containing protein [Zoogloeaceae bacterium]|jgi:uncharacterized membrane protein YhaH (DUF805 family)|nr:DUF805 domain-containing protein [Zoogloeaceae bacterium]